jgi:hypothetical protein
MSILQKIKSHNKKIFFYILLTTFLLFVFLIAKTTNIYKYYTGIICLKVDNSSCAIEAFTNLSEKNYKDSKEKLSLAVYIENLKMANAFSIIKAKSSQKLLDCYHSTESINLSDLKTVNATIKICQQSQKDLLSMKNTKNISFRDRPQMNQIINLMSSYCYNQAKLVKLVYEGFISSDNSNNDEIHNIKQENSENWVLINKLIKIWTF